MADTLITCVCQHQRKLNCTNYPTDTSGTSRGTFSALLHFSTKCNPVLVLDWCWRHFQVSSPCESDKNRVAFSGQSWLESHVIMPLYTPLLPTTAQWRTTCVCSCCSWLCEALWGFVRLSKHDVRFETLITSLKNVTQTAVRLSNHV